MVSLKWASSLADSEWSSLLCSGDPRVPSMPPIEIQALFVGSHSERSFEDVSIFWKRTKEIAGELGIDVALNSRVLDVGVGWGRFYRWLLRDLDSSRIAGIDIDPAAVSMCREMMPWGAFYHVSDGERYPTPQGKYNIVLFFSVFSHLSEVMALRALESAREALEIGGLLVLTTLRPLHINKWADQLEMPPMNNYLSNAGFDAGEFWERATEGEFLYVPTGGGSDELPPEKYGEAVVPKVWWQNIPGYRLVQYDRFSGLPQAYVALQKL